MMAWEIHFPHAVMTSPEGPDSRSAIPLGIFTFREAASAILPQHFLQAVDADSLYLYIKITMRRSKNKQSPEKLLDSRLKPGEQVLWKGCPAERNWTCGNTGKFLFGTVLFSLCLAFFLMLPQFVDLWLNTRMKSYRNFSGIGLVISVLIITSLLVHSLHLLTSPWRKRKTRSNTRYIFTNQRLITIIR